jgi:hypothetical protein
MLTEERTKAEARRATLADERDALLAAEAKNAPKRQREREKADAALQAAEDAARRERLAHAETYARTAAAAVGPASRLNAIEAEMRRLADPSIGIALRDLGRMADGLRLSTASTAGDRLAHVRAVRSEVEGLTLAAGVDTAAHVARLMASVTDPSPVGH